MNFEALAGSSKVASAAGDDSTHKILGERKYMEVLFYKEQTFNKVTNPTMTTIIAGPTDHPVLIKEEPPPAPLMKDLPAAPLKLQKCPRCNIPLPISVKFCGRCGLNVKATPN